MHSVVDLLLQFSTGLGGILVIAGLSGESLSSSFLGSFEVLVTETLSLGRNGTLTSIETFVSGHGLNVLGISFSNGSVGHFDL
ncbi:hypothetical protein V8B55DRAFT_1507700 [Mucor lusitanicus]